GVAHAAPCLWTGTSRRSLGSCAGLDGTRSPLYFIAKITLGLRRDAEFASAAQQLPVKSPGQSSHSRNVRTVLVRRDMKRNLRLGGLRGAGRRLTVAATAMALIALAACSAEKSAD